MATITININGTLANKFRRTVKQECEEGKGILGKAVEEALDLWIQEKEEIVQDNGFIQNSIFFQDKI